ncbi:MAG: glycosyltransferase, partial [Muribaculaceae bacterium]|nr:glycosyltransferase [Muribaculaceae bacterium]
QVVICVRDRISYDTLSAALPNRILLVPDMAFFFNPERYSATSPLPSGRTLFVRRIDKELSETVDISIVPDSAEIHDWPVIENPPQVLRRRLERKLRCSRRFPNRLRGDCSAIVTDRFWHDVIRPAYLTSAVDFIGKYSAVYSTRLHVSILAILMGKEVHVLDNNYQKTRRFLDTWIPGWETSPWMKSVPVSDSAVSFPRESDGYEAADVEMMRYKAVRRAFHNPEISNVSAAGMLRDFLRLYPRSEYSNKLRLRHLLHRRLKKGNFVDTNFGDSCAELYRDAGVKRRGVLLLSHEMTLTGAPRALFNMAVALKKSGYKPVILSLRGGDLMEEARAAGVPVFVDPLIPFDFIGEHIMRRQYFGSFPVVLFNTIDMMAHVGHYLGLPCHRIGWIHEARQGYPKAGLSEGFGRIAGLFEQIYCVSDYARDVAIRHGAVPDKTGLLPFGIEPLAATASGETGEAPPDGRLRIVVAGSVSEWKGCGVLAGALRKLNAETASRIKIVIAGRVVDMAIERQLLCDNAVEVECLGTVSHNRLMNIMSESDLLLCPSLDESMSIACIEAMQHCKPVVTTDATGIASFITDGENGFVIPAGNSEALAEVLERVGGMRESLSEIGKRGRDIYARNFTLEIFEQRVKEVFFPRC